MNYETLLPAIVGLLLAAVLILNVRLWLRSRNPGAPGGSRTNGPGGDVASAASERHRAAEIIDRMAEGVLVLDHSLRPVLANPSARAILGLHRVTLPHRLPSEEILMVARRALDEGEGGEQTISVWFPKRRTLRVRATALDGRAITVFLQDVTEEQRTQQIRREFVAHASHELKSPAAGLQALAEAAREAVTAGDHDAAVRFATRLCSEAERLGRLVGELLDLSRLEDPARAPDEEIDLGGVVRREIAAVREVADDKEIEIHSKLAAEVWVRGDDRHLGQMLRNLLDNAVRYTPSGGVVSVDVVRQDEDAVLSVTDTGIGIPREAQERIFERFYRVDRARSRDRGGTGLGLAIVKHAVEFHGGRIELESELGQGSKFTIHLPLIEDRPRMRSVVG
jgi:signal transduction histidine kinase